MEFDPETPFPVIDPLPQQKERPTWAAPCVSGPTGSQLHDDPALASCTARRSRTSATATDMRPHNDLRKRLESAGLRFHAQSPGVFYDARQSAHSQSPQGFLHLRPELRRVQLAHVSAVVGTWVDGLLLSQHCKIYACLQLVQNLLCLALRRRDDAAQCERLATERWNATEQNDNHS